MRFSVLTRRMALLLIMLLMFTVPALAGHGDTAKARKGILLVAFGTTVPEARVALSNIEKKVHAAFPDVEIRWAYSAKQVRNTVKEVEGTDNLSPASALARMGDEGFTHIAVQSLQTIPGAEYSGLLKTVEAFCGMPKGAHKVTLGAPLMSSPADMERVAAALVSSFPTERKPGDAVVLMGHGTHHPANIYYPGMQYYIAKADPNAFIGTVEGVPSLDDVVSTLAARKIHNVWLMPFMSVAGDHAHNDMAGPDPDSWKSVLEKRGIKVQCVLKGTGEYDSIVAIWVDHLKTAFAELDN